MSLGRPRGGIIGGPGAAAIDKGPILGHDLSTTLPLSKSIRTLHTSQSLLVSTKWSPFLKNIMA